MRKIFNILAMLSLTAAPHAFAHGSDKPGPHKGYIQMPGGFHTEVVPGAEELKVYLLDISFKNPTTGDSSVIVRLIQGNTAIEIPCKPRAEYYSCDIPKGSKLDSGVLEVLAIRQGEKGIPARYTLPLSFSKPMH